MARKRSEQPRCWLLAASRAALGWLFTGIIVLLPLSHLPEMHAAERVLLIASAVLSVGTGFILMLWAADTIRDRG